MSKKFDRRNFVKLSTGVISGNDDHSGNSFLKEATAKPQSGSKPLRLGFIGVGGRGSYLAE